MINVDLPVDPYALEQDARDPLQGYRHHFMIPKNNLGSDCVYLAGNSLGLQPKKAREYISEELDDWAKLGVEGHFRARHPWLHYHENLTVQTARLVGAQPIEVVVMNTLTVNLHLMMISFYRPSRERYKILIERGPFPSDRYAVGSQARLHGFDPSDAILELSPRPGEALLRTEDILETIDREGSKIALIMMGSPNYLTGQAFDVPTITRAGHGQGCRVGFDFAHGAGNLALKLHDWGLDFAVWCNYKYLNAGPGGLAGCFVHERHAKDPSLQRLAGWWGQNKQTRFEMGPHFDPIDGAEGWQLSNPPIFQLAALRASMEIFDQATMAAIRKKGDALTAYLEHKLTKIPGQPCTVITPSDPLQRGSQLSLKFKGDPKSLLKKLEAAGVICDFREPDIIRAAPAPLYNSFSDVSRFTSVLERL